MCAAPQPQDPSSPEVGPPEDATPAPYAAVNRGVPYLVVLCAVGLVVLGPVLVVLLLEAPELPARFLGLDLANAVAAVLGACVLGVVWTALALLFLKGVRQWVAMRHYFAGSPARPPARRARRTRPPRT